MQPCQWIYRVCKGWGDDEYDGHARDGRHNVMVHGLNRTIGHRGFSFNRRGPD